jgi:hypothetical protein
VVGGQHDPQHPECRKASGRGDQAGGNRYARVRRRAGPGWSRATFTGTSGAFAPSLGAAAPGPPQYRGHTRPP